MSLTLPERWIKKEKRNNLLDLVNIYLSERMNKHTLKLHWNCIILRNKLAANKPLFLYRQSKVRILI